MNTPSPILSLTQVATSDLDRELTVTRRMLARVPDEHLGWKPHERSMTLGALAMHIANILYWQLSILQEDGIDLADNPPARPPGSRAEVLEAFDARAEQVRGVIAGLDADVLGQPWQLRHSGHVRFERPRAAVLREWGISHLVHHRGQLSVYLRLLDVPLPSVYGPTADEGPS
ncbi:MAG: DinB family protein [Rhodothermales bacterium]|nr:DinB family protein [Rhodothermales bacterium]